jgi:hypothetical protein
MPQKLSLHEHLIFAMGDVLAINGVKITLGMTQVVNRI